MSLDDRPPAAVLADLEASATRHETPCGDGVMVWRAWGSGPPLLLLHGAHGSWAHWVRNIEDLARFRTVWAADLPGCGDSDLPARPDDVASFAEALATGLTRLAGGEVPTDIVAFSLSGVITANLAALEPDLVRRVVLVDTGGLGAPRGSLATFPVRGLDGEALAEAHKANLGVMMFRDPDNIDPLALHIQAMNVPRNRVNPAPMILPDKLAQVLPRVRAQIDAIWGQWDGPHPNPALQHAILRRYRPDSEMRVVPGAGHWSMYEGAEAFNSILRDLLTQPLR